MRTIPSLLCLLAGLGLAQGPSLAADAYPALPLTLVIPYQEGSDTDSIGRLLGAVAQKRFGGQPIKFENKTGADGITAALLVREAPADAYTLMVARVGTHAIAPNLQTQRPYETEEFTTLAILSTNPMICAVPNASPYQNSRELLDALRKQPGKLRYSTVGPGTIQNLAAQFMLSLAGVKPDAARALHLKTAPAATEALINGEADFICNNANSVLPAILAGKVRGLFSTSPTRLALAPKLPTAREVGLRDMGKIQGWTALMGPAKLPPKTIKYWQELLKQVAVDPEWLSGNARMGAQSAITSIKAPEQFVSEQSALYEQLITIQDLRK